ncbi:hypothetical protein [Priestia aryabhattai]|uniref:hypothetical protein n=1 Tax=Priestia aryabhattai TaxID=412384 RepID=UPI0018734744|nr:hypothetical protein [Priestia aryabhattai]MBE5103420.1 hypothetical protein [Priestia aryabhattai]
MPKSEELIPKMSSLKASEKHKDYKNHWKNFSRRMQKHPFTREFHFKLSKGICAWCDKTIDKEKFVLHHIDYDHKCINQNSIKILKPTPKRPNRKIQIPNCEECAKNYPLEFSECMKRVVPVHQICNLIISKRSPE